MKGFLKFIVFVGVIAAAVYYGRPYAEKFLDERAAEQKSVPVEAKDPVSPVKPVPEKKPEPSELEEAVMELYPAPNIPPLLEMVNNWTSIPERVFPRNLETNRDVDFELVRNGKVIGARKIPEGSAVIGTAFEDGKLTISPVGSELMTAKVEIDAVNLKESIEKGYASFVESANLRVTDLRKTELSRMKTAINVERIRLTGWTDGDNAVFEPMRESIRKGAIKGYELADAKRWRWIGAETVGGREYEVGLVELYSETIFGIFPTEAKALIRGGEVEKWVDPVSGEPFTP